MQKVINDEGKLVLVRELWMQQILSSTYHQVAIVAIQRPQGIDGAWEYAVSEHLKRLWKNPRNHPYLKELFDETGVDGITQHTFDVAASMIVNSQRPVNENI